MRRSPLPFIALVLTLVLFLAACGSDSNSDEESSSDQSDEPETTTTEEPTTTEAPTTTVPGTDLGDTVNDELGDVDDTTTAYSGYTSVTDDSGFLTVEVPNEWSDVDGSAGLFGPDVTASTDVQQFFQTYNVSGMEFQATDAALDQTPDQILSSVSQGQQQQCTPQPVQPYSDPLYTGDYQLFEDCAGTTTDFVWVTFVPADNSFHGVVGVQILNQADLEALDHVLNTFVVHT